MIGNEYPALQAARIVAGTLTLLSREVREVGPPADLWTPHLAPEYIRDVAASVSRGQAFPLWVEDRHPARGLMIYSPSDWESEFFGYGCARLQGPFMVTEDQFDRENRVRRLARQAIELGREFKARLITVKAPHDPAILRGFLAEDFVLAEIGATLWGRPPAEPLAVDLPSGFVVADAAGDPDLAETAAREMGDFFYDGHFRHDPQPGPEEARRLWSRVLADDLSGLADPALILWDRQRGRVAGLATARLNGTEAGLSILALSQPYRGRGLGRPLLMAILNRLSGRADCLRVETASYNLPALALYQSCGFGPGAPLAALHCHL